MDQNFCSIERIRRPEFRENYSQFLENRIFFEGDGDHKTYLPNLSDRNSDRLDLMKISKKKIEPNRRIA